LTRYLLRRLAFAVFLVFAVSSASLLLTRLGEGDYVTGSLGIEAHRETVERARARYGLDKTIGAQYREWLGHALRFDFGNSLLYDRPVRDLVPERAANTALLAVSGLLLATAVGIPLGIVSGTRQRRPIATLIRSCSILFLSLPPLLTSLALVFLAARTGWLPISGMRSAVSSHGAMLDMLRHLIVPATALALPLAAMFERLQSQAIGEVIDEPFVVAARARGVPTNRIIWRDALKPALLPVTAVYGLAIGTLLSGSFAVEVITSWPGLGSLMLDALRARDLYLVAGCAGAGALFLAAGTLISDVTLALVDPRARS
jgi:peptide/nickel transport system permease protein